MKGFLKMGCIAVAFFCIPSFSFAQSKPVTALEKIEDIAFGSVLLPELTVRTSSNAYIAKYNYTKRYVLKCIALANYIRDISNNIDDNISSIDKKRQKKKYLKSEREKLFSTFSDIVKDMSTVEGNFFNKLVYRQTGITTFEVIKKYQGSGKAMMWQTVSRMGGANLKLTYDPVYADKVIEDVMKQIESGKLKTPRLPQNVQEFNNPVYE